MNYVRIQVSIPDRSGVIEARRGVTIEEVLHLPQFSFDARVGVHSISLNGDKAWLDTVIESDSLLTVSPTKSNGAARDPLFDIIGSAPPSGIPDFAEQHDHYLYGTPRRQ